LLPLVVGMAAEDGQATFGPVSVEELDVGVHEDNLHIVITEFLAEVGKALSCMGGEGGRLPGRL
jgi:hypothetical protein